MISFAAVQASPMKYQASPGVLPSSFEECSSLPDWLRDHDGAICAGQHDTSVGTKLGVPSRQKARAGSASHRIWIAAGLVVATALAKPAFANPDQYVMSTSTLATTRGTAFDTPLRSDSGSLKSEIALEGTESSQCTAYGRHSAANGLAEFTKVTKDDSSSTFDASVTAMATGGHYRTCGQCLAHVCVGIFGNDTRADARAEAVATTQIKFSETARPIFYELRVNIVSTGDAGDTEVVVSDDDGKQLLKTSTSTQLMILGTKNRLFTVRSSIASKTDNVGGCCSSQKTTSTKFNVALNRAPLLYAAETSMKAASAIAGSASAAEHLYARIVGGQPAGPTQFPAVGALLKDGKPHCTATLIKPQVIVTAAHCVFNYDVSGLEFALGTNAWDPTSKVAVLKSVYPMGELGVKYDDPTLQDDIAVVKLATASNVPSMSLYSGLPSISDVISQHKSLVFVGYGYDLVDGSPADVGVKRFVSMILSPPLDESTFRYTQDGKNTCNGDSGGPAFLAGQDGGRTALLVTGVTSGGDAQCLSFGVDTRIDRYLPWINAAIRAL